MCAVGARITSSSGFTRRCACSAVLEALDRNTAPLNGTFAPWRCLSSMYNPAVTAPAEKPMMISKGPSRVTYSSSCDKVRLSVPLRSAGSKKA